MSFVLGEGKLTCDRIKYWMRFAKSVEDSENPCLSRKIGVVAVDPVTGDLISTGHNGPPNGCPSCDDPNYLQEVVWPQLTAEERNIAASPNWCHFATNYGGCGICPRRIIKAPSGRRLELCTCAHAEHNAVVSAHRSVVGCYMICHCGVPCIECCKTIIKGGIKSVVCLTVKGEDYSPYSSRWMLKNAGVELQIQDEEYFNS